MTQNQGGILGGSLRPGCLDPVYYKLKWLGNESMMQNEDGKFGFLKYALHWFMHPISWNNFCDRSQ